MTPEELETTAKWFDRVRSLSAQVEQQQARIRVLEAALKKAHGLLDEVYNAHRDKESADYNECESVPCQWCSEVDEVRASTPSKASA